MSTFQIPLPFRAWCHNCSKGFVTIDDIQDHNKKNRENHQQRRVDAVVPEVIVKKDVSVTMKNVKSRVGSIATKQPLSQAPVDAESFDFGPPCTRCGAIMEQAGSCYTCPDCGETTGCS